jgi:hypothetical protein
VIRRELIALHARTGCWAKKYPKTPPRKILRVSPTHSVDCWRQASAGAYCWAHRGSTVDIFEERIRGRYLDLTDRLDRRPYAGFAVLALDSLLIETLEQFIRGVPNSDAQSRAFFMSFLSRPYCEVDGTIPFAEGRGRLFYDHFRCGILHQAESKNNSRVTSNPTAPIVAPAPDGKGLVVNSHRVHAMVRLAFERYLLDLRCLGAQNDELRLAFQTKMG